MNMHAPLQNRRLQPQSQRTPSLTPHHPSQPFAALHTIIGNQALQRLLVQRDEDSDPETERARARLRESIDEMKKYITGILGHIQDEIWYSEKNKQARSSKHGLVRQFMQLFEINGIFTLPMIDSLQEAVKTGSGLLDEYFDKLRDYVREKDELEQALTDDPVAWYRKLKEANEKAAREVMRGR